MEKEQYVRWPFKKLNKMFSGKNEIKWGKQKRKSGSGNTCVWGQDRKLVHYNFIEMMVVGRIIIWREGSTFFFPYKNI